MERLFLTKNFLENSKKIKYCTPLTQVIGLSLVLQDDSKVKFKLNVGYVPMINDSHLNRVSSVTFATFITSPTVTTIVNPRAHITKILHKVSINIVLDKIIIN